MNKFLLGALSCLLTVASFCQTNILPTPSFVELTNEEFILEEHRVTIPTHVFTREQFAVLEAYYKAVRVVLEETDSDPMVSFSYRKHLLPEAYGIEIGDKIEIAHNTDVGQFYGMISLIQLIDYSADAKKNCFPKGRIEDAPKFEWRGLHLDVSRHFFSVDEVKSFIETMATYKFNTFHWHLTDDQGWRIEIKKYPKLTEIGGFRDSTVIGHYNDSPRKYDQNNYGGFYTQEDIKEVVAFAKEMHINVVPEIEMPGHSRAALAAYPELSCTGEQQGVPGLWGIFDDIYCSKEESIVFLQDVLGEVLELFPSEYIHIGGDEAPKTRWNECSQCQKVIKENDLHDSHELQSYFIKRMDQFLTEKGRKLIGWDEILEGGLSPNAAVMSWRDEAGGIEAAKQGHYVVMSPTSYCYFDYYQSSHDSEPLAIGGFLPLEKVYQYNPIPEDLSEEEAKFILGGQANVWTEYIPEYYLVEYMTYPRALALMQGLWCQNKPSYSEFLKVYLNYHEDNLSVRGVNRSISLHIPEHHVDRMEGGVSYKWFSVDTTATFRIWEYSDAPETTLHELKNGDSIPIMRGHDRSTFLLKLDADNSANYVAKGSDILGAEVYMNPPPHEKYNHNGSLNLVDGIHGFKRWKGDEWLGFNDKKIELTVTLEEVATIDSLTIGFLNQNGSWIYLPEQFNVKISEDGEEWTALLNYELDDEEKLIVRPGLNVSAVNASAKHVKFEVIPLEKIPEGNGGAGYTPWTFIDEIQIFTR